MISTTTVSSALVDAAKDGHISVCRSMLDAGADLNAQAYPDDPDSQGSHGLITAAVYGHVAVVQLLLDHGATVDKISHHPVLNGSHRRADVGLLSLLIERGADPETRGFETYTRALPEIAIEMMMPRSRHLVEEHLQIIRLMIDNGYDMDAYDRFGHNALMNSVLEPHDELFDLLMEKGANVNSKVRNSDAGVTVLSKAVQGATIQQIRRLLDKGAEITSKGGSPPLLCAAARGRNDVLTLFLNRGANIHALDMDGRTALHEAAKNGQRETIKFLVDSGIALEAKSTRTGMRPLHEAASHGQLDAVELLLDYGANVNAVDDKGESVMHHAVFELNRRGSLCAHGGWGSQPSRPRLEVLRLLLSRGGDLAVLDSKQRTLLHRVIQKQFQRHGPEDSANTVEEAIDRCPPAGSEAVQLLLSLGMEINAQDKNGDTPLRYAAHHRNVAIIRLLLEAGADIEAQNHDGETPLFETVNLSAFDDAKGRGYRRPIDWTAHRTMEMLLDAGANVNARRNDGDTLLHLVAAVFGMREDDRIATSILLTRGPAIDVTNSKGETAVYIAEMQGKTDQVEMMRPSNGEQQARL